MSCQRIEGIKYFYHSNVYIAVIYNEKIFNVRNVLYIMQVRDLRYENNK